jgi:Ca2+-binding EF-hand superfamily protein
MDKDSSGMLTYTEFRDSFRTLSYGLNDNDINMLIALADEDENERINWKEFIPIGIDAIKTFYMRNISKKGS